MNNGSLDLRFLIFASGKIDKADFWTVGFARMEFGGRIWDLRACEFLEH